MWAVRVHIENRRSMLENTTLFWIMRMEIEARHYAISEWRRQQKSVRDVADCIALYICSR